MVSVLMGIDFVISGVIIEPVIYNIFDYWIFLYWEILKYSNSFLIFLMDFDELVVDTEYICGNLVRILHKKCLITCRFDIFFCLT